MSKKFDINTLTLGENAWVEGFANASLASMSNEGALTGEVLIGLAYVIHKRSDPTFTVEKARDLPLSVINELLGDDEVEDDTPKN